MFTLKISQQKIFQFCKYLNIFIFFLTITQEIGNHGADRKDMQLKIRIKLSNHKEKTVLDFFYEILCILQEFKLKENDWNTNKIISQYLKNKITAE